MSRQIDIDAVTRAIQRVGTDVILPKFRRLTDGDIERKITDGYPDDIVTVVDREAEAHLERALLDLRPDAALIGEEVAHASPALLAMLHAPGPVWIVDPIDGTRNFARGDDGFGIMVSFVEDGETRAAWVVLPARQHAFVAERGSGATLDGQRLRVPHRHRGENVRGTFSVRFMPEETREEVMRRVTGRFVCGPFAGASAIDYTSLVRGQSDFLVYYRLLPWDHAAPALILEEAGGRVEHVGGRRYTARSASQLTVAARDPDVAAVVRSWLEVPGLF